MSAGTREPARQLSASTELPSLSATKVITLLDYERSTTT
jgi:hypothetical protein